MKIIIREAKAAEYTEFLRRLLAVIKGSLVKITDKEDSGLSFAKYRAAPPVIFLVFSFFIGYTIAAVTANQQVQHDSYRWCSGSYKIRNIFSYIRHCA